MSNHVTNDWNCGASGHEKKPELCRLCRKALEKLDKALDLHPLQLTREVDIAENAIAELRDMLIELHRQAHDPSHTAEIRRLLESVNTALSLIAGVVYPSAGIERSLIEEARKVLKDAAGPCSITSAA